MSETDDDEGGIDKEALREELREKYEREEREREATQRMSDLLLKGATMTNTHCGTCGDPFFQQDGTTFCPTCHGGPEGVEASLEDPENGTGDVAGANRGGDAGAASGDEAETGGELPAEADAGSDPRDVAADAHSFDAEESPTNPDAARESIDSDAGSDVERDGTDEVVAGRGDPGRGRGAGFGESPDRPAPTDHGTGGDLAGARDSLVAALERFSREAADTDDPRYARECLQAAREAAEALAALRR